MLNIILCVLVAYALCTPLFYAKAVKFGIKISSEPEKTAEEPIFNIAPPKKKPQMTTEQDRIAQILTNIDNYNGTSFGQNKVEVKHG